MRNTIKIGNKPVGIYIVGVLECFSGNESVVVAYIDSKKLKAEQVFRLLGQGGFLISKEYGEEEEYVKLTCKFSGEKCEDGKEAVVEYFPKDNKLRIKGKLKAEHSDEKALIKLLEASGNKENNKMFFHYRQIYKK